MIVGVLPIIDDQHHRLCRNTGELPVLPEDMAVHFKPLLELELEQLKSASSETADARKPVELDQQSVGRLSRIDAMQNQAMANAVDARRNQRISAIEAAL